MIQNSNKDVAELRKTPISQVGFKSRFVRTKFEFGEELFFHLNQYLITNYVNEKSQTLKRNRMTMFLLFNFLCSIISWLELSILHRFHVLDIQFFAT